MRPLKISSKVAPEGGLLFSFVEADLGSRQHRRTIGADLELPEIMGHTIFYSDEYSHKGNETVYVYARHRCDPASFFVEFNDFFDEMLSGDYGELRGTPFPMAFNVRGQILLEEQPLPYLLDPSLVNDVRFFRVDLPFGPLTIEFGEKLVSKSSLNQPFNEEMLYVLDSPLLGCDLSAGFTYLPLLTKLHWAAETLSPSVLRTLASGAAQSVSYA